MESSFAQIADSLKATLGVNALHMESGESISFNGDKRFPMQSVYKFPIGMVMLHKVDIGEFSLEDSIWIDPSEYIPKAGHSLIRNKYPSGVSLPLKEILEYNVSGSDGTACDVLLRLLGGTEKVEEEIHKLGVMQIAISTTEMIQVAQDTIQYQNWSTPEAMSQLFQVFLKGDYLTPKSQKILLDFMLLSNKWFDKRIKGLLPKGTIVAHKTGTARTYDGLCRATNDAGIIYLPDGTHLAVSVFVMDSYDSQEEREKAIAKVAKAVYEFWTEKEE
ncbi:MAG: class A beta-lactamase [Bacteroidota bacterium]